jgi:hypothetical protein
MNFDEQLANAILKKVAQVAEERNLDEEGIKTLIDTAVHAAYVDGPKVMADGMVKQLMQQIPEMVEQERTLRTAFEQRLQARWQKALDLFDSTVILTREAGERFSKKHREQVVKDKNALIEALVRIHIRACQTAAAVSVLLKSGFARDALARQRTLHELAVVVFLLKEHGTSLAERFLLHEVIETCTAAEQYESAYAGLGYDPPDPANLAYARAKRDRLCQRFGKAFKNNYGWATDVIGKERPTFEDLEKAAHLNHLRPYYRMAGYGVHATAKGMVFDIGNITIDSNEPRGLLAGASNAGLADPGHGTLLSLYQCTVTLLTSRSDVEALASLHTLKSFVDEAGQAFLDIHREILEEEKQRTNSTQAHETERNVLPENDIQ